MTRNGTRLATAVSVLALVVALGAMGLAFAAYGRAGETSTSATGADVAPDGPTSTPQADASSTEAEVTPEPSAETSSLAGPEGTPALPTGAADYTVAYDTETVTLRPGAQRGVDFDQPLVNADGNQREATYFTSSYTSPHLKFEAENVAEGKTAGSTPGECARAIQLSPVDNDVVVSQDLVLCIVTNGRGAAGEPDRPKMARIVVQSVADDGTVVLRATAWEIPR